MARLTATLVSVTALLVALPAGAQAAKPWKVRQVARSGTVAPGSGQISRLTIRCPRNYVAASGAFTVYSAGVVPLRAVPSGRRSWIFAVGNARSIQGTFRVVVNCVRLRAPRGFTTKLKVSTRKREITLPGGGIGTLTVRCKRGYAPAGFGGESPGVGGGPARAANFGQLGPADVRAAVPSRGRWQFVLRNFSGSPSRVRMHARCLARQASARKRRRARRTAVASRRCRNDRSRCKRNSVIRRTVEEVEVRPGNNDGIQLDCRRDHVALATAHQIVANVLGTFLYTSWADPRGGGTWNIVSASTQRVVIIILCLDQRQDWVE